MNKPDGNHETHAALFQRRQIRRMIHDDEWWFAIADVVAVLTDAADPSDYLKKMRKRDPDLSELFKGGGGVNLSPPPCPGVRHGRRPAENPVLEYRRSLSPDPVHPQPQGRAVQALARAGRQGTP